MKPDAEWTKGKFIKIHGMTGTKFYQVWSNMKQRCTNKKCYNYKNYGGRGIRIEWNNFTEFKNDMYESYESALRSYPTEKVSIDRKDVYGNYNKSNCRWVTFYEQQINRRDTSRILTLEVEAALGTNDSSFRRWIQKYGTKTALKMGLDHYVRSHDAELEKKIEKMKQLHSHDSIYADFTEYADEGCRYCIENKALYDIQSLLKKV